MLPWLQMRFSTSKCKGMHTGTKSSSITYTRMGFELAITDQERDLEVVGKMLAQHQLLLMGVGGQITDLPQ